MFTGESKKRPTVSLRGKSKEEDRGEFLRRARVSNDAVDAPSAALERSNSSSNNSRKSCAVFRGCLPPNPSALF